MHKKAVLLLLLILSTYSYSQEYVTTFGIQFRPIIPNSLVTDVTTNKFDSTGFEYRNTQNFGYNFGMVIRKGFTENFSLETGINFAQRNYTAATITDTLQTKTDFRIIGYEIPVKGLVYVRLTDEIYMNTSFGFGLDFYPSDIAANNDYYRVRGQRRVWLQPAMLANFGFEYRTEENGYFYIGLSLHRPFKDAYRVGFFDNSVVSTSPKPDSILGINGSYFTLDFRYFFHEEKEDKIRLKKTKAK